MFLIKIISALIVFVISNIWYAIPRDGDTTRGLKVVTHTIDSRDYTKEEFTNMMYDALMNGKLLDHETHLVVKMSKKEAKETAEKMAEEIYGKKETPRDEP